MNKVASRESFCKVPAFETFLFGNDAALADAKAKSKAPASKTVVHAVETYCFKAFPADAVKNAAYRVSNAHAVKTPLDHEYEAIGVHMTELEHLFAAVDKG